MRAYMETGFYVLYLALMTGVGLRLLLRPRRPVSRLFGAACLVLGCGDAFHLIPRAVGLFTGTLDAPGPALAAWLGVGKLITSLTMTAFYLLVYLFIYRRAEIPRRREADIAVGLLAVCRLILCALPQNGWLTNDASLLWGVLRNLPFTVIGILVIAAAARHLRTVGAFRLLWLAMILSFAFYLPVVLWAGTVPWVGMLMLPKTVCYGWIAGMALADDRAA